jgi:hypothetical protein
MLTRFLSRGALALALVAAVTSAAPAQTFSTGTIAADGALIWRDYNVNGVPGSGIHNPSKADIRALWGVVGGAINSTFAFTQSGTSSVARTFQSKLSDAAVTPQDKGALANSNGTPGNGNDDTLALSKAMDEAPAGNVHLPCGVYRLTSTITKTAGVYHLSGEGYCTKIYLDSASAIAAFDFNFGAFCPTALLPCVSIEGVNFITPRTATAGNYAVKATNNQHFRFVGNFVDGYRVGVQLASSYSPTITGNTFTNTKSTAVYLSADATANGALIQGNRGFGNGLTTSDAAFFIGDFDAAFTFSANDLESNYGCAIIGSGPGGVITGNFCEASTGYPLYFTGTSTGFTITGNWFSDSITVAWNLSNSTITHNRGFTTVTWPGTATGNVYYDNPAGWGAPTGPVLDNSGWTQYTPAVTSLTGSITTLGTHYARVKTIGRTLHLHAEVTITTNGTGATGIRIPTSTNAATSFSCAGYEDTAFGMTLQARGSPSGYVDLYKYDNTYPGANNAHFVVDCTYEIP